MEYKKSIIIIILAIFLLSIASVSASDADDATIASQNNLEIDQTADDVIGAGEDTDLVSSEENEILGADVQTFAKLNATINGNTDKDIYLNGNYKYSDGDDSFKDGIVINRDVNIYGNGATINGSNEARIFQINGGNVVFYNITFVNGNAGDEFEDYGGAIIGNCKAINCTFTANHAFWGGAMYEGSAVNCSFSGNTANDGGGAMYEGSAVNCSFSGNVANCGGAMSCGSAVNCSFSGNTATSTGGAIYMYLGTVENCNFTNNTAYYGGAIYFKSNGNVINCNFNNNTANGSSSYGGAVYFQSTGTVANCNFTGTKATGTNSWGGAVYFDSDGDVRNCNFTDNEAYNRGGAIRFGSTGNVTNCNFADNTATYGGAVNFLDTGNVTNCNFADNTATYGGAVCFWNTGNVTNCNFTDNKATGTYSYGGAVYFSDQGNVTNCNFTNNKATGDGGAIYFAENSDGRVINCNLTNNHVTGDESCGGAIYFAENSNGTVTNCNFTNNHATYEGGAVYFDEQGTVTNCNFTNNSARYGGAIEFWEIGTVENCNFMGNNATTGSAIYFLSSSSTKTVSNSTFLNNRANTDADNPLQIEKDGNGIKITFTGQNNLLNAIYSRNDAEVSFTNVIYWGANGITNTGSSTITPSRSNKEAGQNITVAIVVNDKLVYNDVKVTDENGTIVLDVKVDGSYYISVRHDEDSYYTEAKNITSNMKFYANVTSLTTTNKTVNITAKSNIYSEFMSGKLLFVLPNGDVLNATYASNGTWWAVHTFDDYADYQVNASYIGLDNVTITNATISIVKANSTVNVSDVVLTYGESKEVTVTTTGATGITAKIDNDQVSVIDNYTIPISGLNAGNYTLTVTTIPDDDHNATTKTVNITVNKIDSKLTVGNVELNYGESKNVTVTTEGATGITAKINENNITVINNYTIPISGLAAGNYTLKVTTIPDNNHNSVTKTVNITVNKAHTEIAVDSATVDIKVLDEVPSGATLTPADAGNLTYASSNETVVIVKDGKIKALAKGTATITVSFNGNDNYSAAENKTITVNISLNDATIDVNNKTLDLFVDDNFTIVATTSPKGLNVTFVPDNSGVVSINNKGVVTALKEGTASILVKVGGDGVYAENSTTVAVSVNKIPTEISLTNATVDLYVLDEISSGATLTPADAGNLTYTSGNESVTIVKDGKIIAVGAGKAVITVSFSGDDKYAAAENKNITITVNLKDATVTVNNSTLDLFVDDTFTVVATTVPDGLNVTFVQDDSGVYSVDDNGVVTALKEGTASIAVKVGGDGVYVENSTIVAVTVSKVPTEIIVQNATVDMKVTDEVTPVVSLMPSGAGELDFTSGDVSVVTVDGIGTITAVGEGSANVTVRFIGNDKYAAAESKNITVTVSLKDASVSVNNSTLNLSVDDTFNIVATTTPAGLNVTYIPDNSGVISVDENGEVTALKEGNATITVKVGGDGVYVENSTAITVTVNKQDANVDVSMPENVTVGDNSTVNVKLPSDAAGNVTVKVDGEVVDTVQVTDGSADVTIPSLNAGNHTVEIAYSGDDKYNPVSATKDITVSKKETTPEIDVEGSNVDVKLPSDATGNVTVKVDDTVVSTVPVTDGTASVKLPKLSAGNHTVEIAYSGDDKYKSASKIATISVDKDSTKLTADNVTATYNVKKYLTITLTDSQGSPIANATVSVKLKSAKNYVTDANGQVKVKVSSLVPKTYTAKISFNGDDNYIGSNTTAKVTVKKATPKITAKAKIFKTTAKTKKYTITLKNNIGKPIKKATVYLKVGGKTYKATTNSKGKATFKITKLNKKGTYKATVTYKGNKYYTKVTKKANIKVISTFKTIAKGSKLKNMVKIIQMALKSNGYYLSYNGHYLMVDGIFEIYTEMAVKDFQKNHGLKVTGKVDEKTAKKLKII